MAIPPSTARNALAFPAVLVVLALAACHGSVVDTADLPATQLFTDPRDGERYAIVTIGRQTWMAENLRYDSPGSRRNPYYPTPAYGRLYSGVAAQTACPEGWHLPTDDEWNELEIALGMSVADTEVIGWRGTHGTLMKSTIGWSRNRHGSNASGFNGLPSGYYDGSEWSQLVEHHKSGEPTPYGLGGLGTSAGYWAAAEDGEAWIRFIGGPKAGVNRMASPVDEETDGLACRCVKD